MISTLPPTGAGTASSSASPPRSTRSPRRRRSARGTSRAACPGSRARARPARAPRPARSAPASRRGARRPTRTASTMCWFAATASGVKRGSVERKSSAPNSRVRRDRARQETAAERRERDERRAVGGAPGRHVLDVVARPERQLRLDRGHRVDPRASVRAPGSSPPTRPAIGPCPRDEPRHRAPGLLDRHLSGRCGAGSRGRCVDAQPAERGVARLADVLGPSVAPVLVFALRDRSRRTSGRPWSRRRRARGGPASARPTSDSFV